MKKVFATAAVAVMFVAMVVFAATVAAQEKPVEKPAQALDELTSAWVDSVVLAAQAEQTALESVKGTTEYKRYEQALNMRQQLQADRTKKIEAKFPGFTLDWDKRTLVTKKTSAPAK